MEIAALKEQTVDRLVNAHLCALGANPQKLSRGHAYIEKNLSAVLRHRVGWQPSSRRNRTRWMIDWIRPIAREIELLAPAVKAGGARQANCEYPWEEANQVVHYPAAYSFPNLGILNGREGVAFVKLLRTALEELC